MDYKTNLVLHISFSFFFLFLVHCLYSIVFLISFMDFLINKLYLVSCMVTHSGNLLKDLSDGFPFCQYFTSENIIR